MAGRPAGTDRGSRIAILQAAVECFSRNGYQGTTMRDISRVSGLGQPTIYHFYGSKENLFRIALRSTHLAIMRVLRRGVGFRNTGGAGEELLGMFRAVEAHHRRNPEQIHLIFRLLYTAPPEIRDGFVEQYADDYSRLVRRSYERNEIEGDRDEDGETRVGLLIHVFQGYLLDLSRSAPGTGSRTDYAALLKFILER